MRTPGPGAGVTAATSATAVGIDIGTTNTKVVLVAVQGPAVTLLATARSATPAPDALAGTLHRLVAQVLAGAAGPPLAVGVASMAETGVPLGADGRPLGPWLRWDGHRAGDEAVALAGRLGAAELFGATGVRPAAKVPLATWAWLRAHRPDTWSAMRRWAGVADLACLALTGRLVTDHTLAGRTMAYRLPAWPAPPPRGFDGALLGEVGLRPEQLPEVAGPDDVAGAVRDPDLAGVPVGTPVVVAGHDHAVGAFAAGARRPGAVADSIGTAEAVYTVLARDPDRAGVAAAGMSLVRTVAGRPALLAGSSSAGAMVEWWLRHVAAGAGAEQVFADAASWWAAHPDDEPPVVLPYVAGRQTPAPDPEARVRIVGGGSDEPSGRLAAGMVDGLALQARWMLDVQLALAGGAAPDRLVVLGGPAAANPTWMAAKARHTPVPVDVVDCAEPVGVGAALLALARAGVVPDPPALPAAPAPSPAGRPGVRPGGRAPSDDPLARFVRAATQSPDPKEVPA